MVHYRRELVLQRIMLHRPMTVIEVGCGPDPLVVWLARGGGTWAHWHIVEPASAFVEASRVKISGAALKNVTIHEAFFEDVDLGTIKPDMIICAGLLHEVPSSEEMLRRLANAMGPRTVLHASVPNAKSFHRRLAKAMGLISSLDELSQRNTDLDQRRVFDLQGLVTDVERAGMRITSTGGFLIKPFTHTQMEGISDILSPDVLDGLNVLGREHPEWASEIWAEAVLS
jgi:2-polyprenyl-3-methyl-5-hydroxy-6-metoxy-1,4-benzoquinol methylase